MNSLLRRPLFHQLHVESQLPPNLREKIVTFSGDLQQPDLGLTKEDLNQLLQDVTHVIHAAACINFDDPIMVLVSQNYDVSGRKKPSPSQGDSYEPRRGFIVSVL